MDENLIGKAVVDARVKIHRVLDPGSLESLCGIKRGKTLAGSFPL